MRRLRAQQTVALNLDRADERKGTGAIDASVLAVEGSAARLSLSVDAAPREVGRLVRGALGYLVFVHRGAPIGLRGLARAGFDGGPHVDFVVVDGVQLPERRAHERVPIVTRATIAPLEGSGATQRTFTVDISPDGALLRCPRGLPEDERYAIELYFGDDPAPVSTEATIARRTGRELGLHFEDMSAEERRRLVELLAGHRHGPG